MLKKLLRDLKKMDIEDRKYLRDANKIPHFGGKLDNYDDLIIEKETPPRLEPIGAKLKKKGGK